MAGEPVPAKASNLSATVVAVNPSPWTEIERTFWHNLAASFTEQGWRFIEITPFDEPTNPSKPGAERIVVPVLWRFGSDGRAPMGHLDARDPEWLTEQDVYNIAEFEDRRERLQRVRLGTVRGVRRMARLAESMMREFRPSVVLTTNKIEPHCAIFRKAALHHGSRPGLIERSPLDSIWYEPNGLFTESKLWTMPRELLTAEPKPDARRRVVGNPAGFRPHEMNAEQPSLAGLPGPVVFCPFDNILWTGWSQPGHAQGVTDNPAFKTPQDAIDSLSSWVASKGGSLVIKSHPGCLETEHLGFPPNTFLVDAALDHLIESSDLTVAFNTKVAFVALAAGRKTATLAHNPAAASGLTTHWTDFPSVHATLDAALEAPSPQTEAVDAFFTWLDESYFWDENVDESRSPAELASMLIEQAGADLTGTSAEAITRLRDYAAGDPAAVHPALRVTRPAPTSKGRVFLDVTRLVEPGSATTGIARYGRETLRQLMSEQTSDVWAVVRKTGLGSSMASLRLHQELDYLCSGRVIYLPDWQAFTEAVQHLGPLTEHDIIHSIHLPLPPRNQTGPAKRMITVHDVLHVKNPEFNPGEGTPFISRVLESIDPKHDFVICDSRQTMHDLLSLHPIDGSRVVTVSLGASPLSKPTSVKRERRVAAFLQSEPRKNARGTIAAAGAVLRQPQYHDVRLTVVLSRGVQLNDALLRDAGISADRIDVLSRPSDDEIGHLFARSQAFLFGSHYEGFGLPIVEAMSHGTPCVVPMNSSLIEVAGDAVCYAASSEPADLADALDRVLRDDAYRQELTEAGLARSAMNTWAHSTARLQAVYAAARTGSRLDLLPGESTPTRATPSVLSEPVTNLIATGIVPSPLADDGAKLFIALDPASISTDELRCMNGEIVMTTGQHALDFNGWHTPPAFAVCEYAKTAQKLTTDNAAIEAYVPARAGSIEVERCNHFELEAASGTVPDIDHTGTSAAIAVGVALGFKAIVIVGETTEDPAALADLRSSASLILHANSAKTLAAQPVQLQRLGRRFNAGSRTLRVGVDFVRPSARQPTGILNSVLGTLQGTTVFRHNVEFIAISDPDNPILPTELLPLRSNPHVEMVLTSDADYADRAASLDAILLPWNDANTTIPIRPDARRIVYINDLIPLNNPGYPEDLAQRYLDSAARADAILCLTDWARLDIAKQLQLELDKCFVAAVGLDPDLIGYVPSTTQQQGLARRLGLASPYLMYPAALRPHKNHTALVDALELVDPSVQLLLTTAESHNTPAGQEFQQDLKRRGLSQRVTLAGRLDRSDYLALLSGADILVAPSRDEGFGIPVAEAQRLGVPAISTRCGALAEVATGSLEIDPDDPVQIAAQITALLASEELRDHTIHAGYSNTTKYTTEWGAHGLLSAVEFVMSLD